MGVFVTSVPAGDAQHALGTRTGRAAVLHSAPDRRHPRAHVCATSALRDRPLFMGPKEFSEPSRGAALYVFLSNRSDATGRAARAQRCSRTRALGHPRRRPQRAQRRCNTAPRGCLRAAAALSQNTALGACRGRTLRRAAVTEGSRDRANHVYEHPAAPAPVRRSTAALRRAQASYPKP